MLAKRLGLILCRPTQRHVFRLSRNLHSLNPRYSYLSYRNLFITGARLSRHRQLTTTAFVPKPFIFRMFWALVTGTVGFIYYKVHEASQWASEKVDLALLAVVSSVMGAFDSTTLIKEALNGWEGLLAFIPANKSSEAGEQPKIMPSAMAPDNDSSSNPSEGVQSIPSSPLADKDELKDFKHFIRKMIEIRNILRAANLDQKFELPSIVVIGSQSSGKSSVLESIVGHEFLPKGLNMVTRRPLELTLVNDSSATNDYGVFTDSNSGPIDDFAKIQHILTEQNFAVPEAQWISDDPIRLTIYSKHIPDLTLIDLPGYIQINNRSQPPVLRDKIADLCEKYIQENNNIILAVCPADVDLANAEALKASRRADPSGERTIGVITKLDLVDPEYGAGLIRSEDYPLKLGYIGVVCKPPQSAIQPRTKLLHILQDRQQGSFDIRQSRYEASYFANHRDYFSSLPSKTGVNSLRAQLTNALETSLFKSMTGILRDVQDELSDVRYQLKVEFSDRNLTPEGYATFLLTSIKCSFEKLTAEFTRTQIRANLKNVLESHLLSVLEKYHLEALPCSDDENLLVERLRRSSAALTRSGIGKVTSAAIVESILKELDAVLSEGPFLHHPQLRKRLMAELEGKLRLRSALATEMVENALKPYKHEIEYTESEWKAARTKVLGLLKSEVDCIGSRIETVQKEVGGKRLRKLIQYLADHEAQPETAIKNRASGLFEKAKEVVHLNHRMKLIKKRLEVLESSSQCVSPVESQSNYSLFKWFLPKRLTRNQPTKLMEYDSDLGAPLLTFSNCHKFCPEIYLYMVHERLLKTSSVFVHHELIHEFLQPLPNDLTAGIPTPADHNLDHVDVKLEDVGVSKDLTQGTVDRQVAMRFVHENPIVARHIELIERRRALERVRDRLLYLKQRKEEAYIESS